MNERIEREDHEWGVRLLAKPFSSFDLFGQISLEAELTRVENKTPTVVIHLNGISRMVEFGVKELQTLRSMMVAFNDEIYKLQHELKQPVKTKAAAKSAAKTTAAAKSSVKRKSTKR
jgi:hypothetical protein